MHGNVFEWTEDCWHESYEGAPVNGDTWVSAEGCVRRVVRGGGWLATPNALRSAHRAKEDTTYRGTGIGFRISKTLTP